MSTYDAATQTIINLAKKAAVARNSASIGIDDIAVGLYLAKSDAIVAGVIFPSQSAADRTLQWPDPIKALGPAAASSPDPARALTVEPELRAALAVAAAENAAVPPAVLVRHLLAYNSKLLTELRSLNTSSTSKPAASSGGALAQFERLRETAESLRRTLADAVIGQDAAVDMLGQAYFRSCVGREAAGPRGILTFLGPPGVGKTMLAEAFGSAVATLEGAKPAFKRFDMGNYAGPQQHEGLFGFEPTYKDAQPGALTGFVQDNPSCVVLFDELEKAHETALLALLAVLDKGEALDKKLGKTVSFKDCWVVVTTNLGREFFANANDSGVLHAGNAPAAVVFEVLATARRRQDVGNEHGQPALPPELVSRLAKGNAVIFGHLGVNHLARLVGRAAADRMAQPKASLPVPVVTIAENARLAFLLSLLPNLDARQVVARAGAWSLDLLQDAVSELRRLPEARDAERFQIVVRAGGDVVAYLSAKLGGAPTRVLIVDDDTHLPDVLARHPGDQPVECQRVSFTADVAAAVRKFRPDAVLLDLSIAEDAWSPRVVTAVKLLQAIREAQPDLPCLLFSDNPENRGCFDDVVARVVRSGGARAFLPCRRKPGTDLEMEDFAARVHAHLDEIRRESVVRSALRERRALRWQTQFRWEQPDLAVAELVSPQDALAMSAADQTGPIRFAGVPSEGFGDVIGLDRAKQRLTQVVQWLRDDGALRAFGVQPPSGFLLAGPPGTGKTLLARALAGEAKLPFLALSAGELQSKWFGESEERIRELFDKARRYAPAIVFLDEIDAIARDRGSLEDSNGAQGRVVNQLLASMDGVTGRGRRVFVLAATNHPDSLDPAIRRPGRFDEVIPIDLPKASDRRKFFEYKLKVVHGAAGVSLDALVNGTANRSPAELDRIMREAIYKAAGEGRASVSADDLEAARRLVCFGADKQGVVVRPDDRVNTAWHEAGHAIVHMALLPHIAIDHVSIVVSERGSLGYMAWQPDEAIAERTAADVRAGIAVAMAGREGELLRPGHHGEPGAGASSDLLHATRDALVAVGRLGMDDEFGAAVFDALPAAMQTAVAEVAQRRVAAWIARGRDEARALLTQHQGALRTMAERLLEQDRIEGAELADIAWCVAHPAAPSSTVAVAN